MKNKFNLIKIIAIVVALITLVSSFAGCSGTKTVNNGEVTKLSFKSALEYDYLKSIENTTVTISGYMATSSPVDGSFMFLMNLPYQSCPFCVPNTSQLSNTMEVYPQKGDSFAYTSQAIKVVGKLEVSESEDKPFTDMYGYEFNFKIVDATYTIIKAEELGEDMALWQKVAESDVVNDIYAMYDYVNFLCAWNTYVVNSYTDEEGVEHPGYYLYPQDAQNFLYKEGAQYNYGTKEGYFDDIIAKIEAVDKEAFADLVANIQKAKALADKALAELENGNYTSEYKYVEKFGTEDYVYTINIGEELADEMDALYSEFAAWLASWEM
ncbi:MAG: hypothetical protein IKT46_03790 [Clostridia bacterium]|nr:hypothetical protein [Clostridia bacterium]